MVDAELWKPSEKDFAFLPPSGSPAAICWWYRDQIFDDGSTLVIMYTVNEASNSGISVQISDPDGNMVARSFSFPPSEVTTSTEALDIKMGDTRYFGKFPRYEMHIRGDDLEIDLFFEQLVQGVRVPPDGVFIGRQQPRATPKYTGWVVLPRHKVTGRLIVAGKDIPVNGHGYGDHGWSPIGFLDMYHFVWARLHLPDHTFVFWDIMLDESSGFQKVKYLIALKGDKLLECSPGKGDYYVDLKEFDIDPVTQLARPRKIVFTIDHGSIKGTVTYRRKYIINQPAAAAPEPRARFYYYRYLCDIHSKLEVDGEKIEADIQDTLELGL